jgi:hypothetical protein
MNRFGPALCGGEFRAALCRLGLIRSLRDTAVLPHRRNRDVQHGTFPSTG